MKVFAKVLGSITVIGLAAATTITWASQPTGGQVITVCPQGPPACQFSKIQEAINAAADGAIIMIAPGIYREQGELKISKNIHMLGAGSSLIQVLTDLVNIEGPAQAMISGLTIQGLGPYRALRVYEATVTLASVDIVGNISVNAIETEAEQPKPSRLTLINVHVLGNWSPAALFIGSAVEAIVSESELVSFQSDVVVVPQNAQLIMSHSLIRSTNAYGEGLKAGRGAKVWLFDTQIEISTLLGNRTGPPAIVANEGSDLVLQRIKIFSTSHGVLAKNARLHMEASQVVAITGWGVSLVIEPCGVRLPPIVDPSPQTFEGLVTGRQNEIISGARELGDVCPSALEFLKTAEGGQYP